MKIKTILLYAWIITLFVGIYASFKTKVKVYLWSWFGYNVGFADIYSNMPIKITWVLLALITFYVYSKDSEKENEVISSQLKFIKKKKQKLTQIKQTVKV